jgi:1,2-dihydroxy-3-keto-5-methylthiopentene dioxygenase
MSSLSVYHVSSPEIPNKVLTHLEDIQSTLAERGVHFERWQAAAAINASTSHEALIAAYREPIDKLMTERGYTTADVRSVSSDHPPMDAMRATLLEEHRIDEDLVRFFVTGRGLFSLHIDDYVYAVLCEKNDLISVPAGVKHWFDMGEHPHFTVIRLFKSPQGCEAKLTGDDIAGQFPRLED